MFAFASLNFRFSRMLAGLLMAGLLLVAAVATWFIASGPAPRATGPAPPTRAGTALPGTRTVSLQTPPLTGRFPVGTMSLRLAPALVWLRLA
jgi:hypothetical protein